MGKKCCCNSQRLNVAQSFVPPDGTVTIVDQSDDSIPLNQENFNYSLYQTYPTSQGDRLLEWTFQIQIELVIEFKSIKFKVPEGIPLHKLPNTFLPSGFLTVGGGSVVDFSFGITSVPLSFSFIEDPKGSGIFCLYGTISPNESLTLLVGDIWGHVEYTI